MSITSMLRIDHITLDILRANGRKRYLVNRDIISIIQKRHRSMIKSYINQSSTKEEKNTNIKENSLMYYYYTKERLKVIKNQCIYTSSQRIIDFAINKTLVLI